MKRILATLAFLLASTSLASAQFISPSLFGYNIALDPTIAGNRVPNASATTRVFPSDCGATVNATMWYQVQTTSGAPGFTCSDSIINQILSQGSRVVVTPFGNPATWVVSPVTNFVLSSGAQLTAYLAYVTSWAAHYTTPMYVELANEFNVASVYSGTIPAANMAAAAQSAYTTLHAAGHIVLAPSFTNLTTPLVAGQPASMFYQVEQLYLACQASGPCFDYRNWHFYPEGPSGPTDPLVKYAAELIVNPLQNEAALAAEAGFSSKPLALGEGYCGNPSTPDFTSDSDQWAGDQAKCLALIAGASPAVALENYFTYGTNNSNKSSFGNLQGNVNGMNASSRALRTVQNLLSDATWTSSLVNGNYISRTAGTPKITNTPDVSPSAIGVLSGTGTNCSPAATGTGGVPSTYFISNSASAGAVVAETAVDTTNHTATYRACGAITTNGTGQGFVGIYMQQPGTAGLTAQPWTEGLCITMTAGSMTNIASLKLDIAELTSGGAGVVDTTDIYLYPVLNQKVCYNLRTTTFGGATTAAIRPELVIAPYFSGNGTVGTLPYDISLTLSSPTLDQGVVWSGSFSRGSCNYTIAWAADQSTPAFSTALGFWIDMYRNSGPVNGGTFNLSNQPTFFSSCSPKATHAFQ